MNEKLIVKDFGPIKNAELDLKKVTVFIGPQGSGKSTLAKLVAICREDERPSLVPRNVTISERIKKYGLDSFKHLKSTFTYNSIVSTIYFQNDISTNTLTTFGEEMASTLKTMSDKYNLIYTTEEHPAVPLLSILIDFSKALKERNIIDVVYIPERRTSISFLSSSLFGLMNNDISLPKTLTEFGNRYSKASTNDSKDDLRHRIIGKDNAVTINTNTKHIELFDLQFQHRDGQDFLIDTKNNYEVNLRDSASGMQSSIPLILVVRNEYSEGNKHFIIEEPELNLFPTIQKQLIGYLADKCTQNGNELLMTTHSPYILSAINNLIFAYKVAHEVPEKAEEVAQIIPREQWLNPDDVAAYYVADGTVTSIIHEGEGLIGENELDAISEDISGERDQLFKILRSKKRETVH
jgi:predicted ATPase